MLIISLITILTKRFSSWNHQHNKHASNTLFGFNGTDYFLAIFWFQRLESPENKVFKN